MRKILLYVTVCNSQIEAFDLTVNKGLVNGFELLGLRNTVVVGSGLMHYQTMVKYDSEIVEDKPRKRNIKV